LYSWLCPWIFQCPDYNEEMYDEEEKYADDYAN
jgi:hypothetical protein